MHKRWLCSAIVPAYWSALGLGQPIWLAKEGLPPGEAASLFKELEWYPMSACTGLSYSLFISVSTRLARTSMNYHSSEFPEVTSSPLPEPVVPVEYRAKLAESGDTDGKGDKATDALAASSNGQRRWMSSISGRRWLIIIGVILVVVVIIALGTSLGVVLSKRNGEKDSAAASRAATGSSMPASSSRLVTTLQVATLQLGSRNLRG